MKRLIFLLGGIILFFSTYATPVKFIGCAPADGSSIDEFKFTLTFDITEAAESLGAGEWGLGYAGNLTEPVRCTTLYKGTAGDGEKLATVLDTSFTGKSEGWTVGNNKIDIVFPDSFVPEENQLYTLVITNNFSLYQAGKVVPKSTVTLKYESDPLVLTFIGKKAGNDKLLVQNISVDDNATLETLKDVRYTFNTPIVTNSEVLALIKENDAVIAQAISMSVEDSNTLVVDFGNDVNLNLGHTYAVILPNGAVSMASDASKTNGEFSFNVNGVKTYTYDVKSISPANGEICLPTKVSIDYEIPVGTKLTAGPNQATNTHLKIYKSEVSEDNLVSDLLGTYNSTNTGLDWDVSKIPYEPSTEYILVREHGLGYLFSHDNKRLPEWTNEGVESKFTTISVEESGVPKVEFQAPVLGVYNANGNNVTLNSGDKIGEITTIDFLLKDLRYSYNGEYVGATLTDTGSGSIDIYDVTDATPVLIKSATLNRQQYETTTYYYSVYRALVNSPFFEGHKYKVVLPAGTFGAALSSIRNFSLNDEYVVEFEGTAPTSVEMISCSLSDNVELSELSSVVWTFKGDFVKNPDSNVIFKTSSVGWELPTYVSTYLGTTTVQAFTCKSDGSPETFQNGKQSQLIFPEGLIYYAGDENIKNSEYTISITGVEKTPEVVAPEFVKVTAEVNGIATLEQQAVKGEKATITIAPTENWIVESVEGATLSGENTYTTPKLTGDTIVKAKLAYDGAWAVEVTTGVWEIAEDNISIARDGQLIVVSGVTPEQTINVYTVGGLLVGTANATPDNEIVKLTVAPGQVYIVTVNGKAAKLQM